MEQGSWVDGQSPSPHLDHLGGGGGRWGHPWGRPGRGPLQQRHWGLSLSHALLRPPGLGGLAAGDEQGHWGVVDARSAAGSEGVGTSIGDPHSPPTTSRPASPPPSALLGQWAMDRQLAWGPYLSSPGFRASGFRAGGRVLPRAGSRGRGEGWSGVGSTCGILEDAARPGLMEETLAFSQKRLEPLGSL